MVIQEIRPVREIAVAGADRRVFVCEAVRFHTGCAWPRPNMRAREKHGSPWPEELGVGVLIAEMDGSMVPRVETAPGPT